MIQVDIADGGIGISAEDLRILFQPYTRAQSPEHIKGVGLGVVIVKKLVEAHGGQVSVQSRPGKGSSSNQWSTIMLYVKTPKIVFAWVSRAYPRIKYGRA